MQFARTGWFYRYEAYFITGSILATALALHSRLEGWFVTTWRQPGWYRRVAIAGLLFVTPAYHEIRGIPSIIAQTRSIYEYEVQLAFFLHRFYDHSSVVIGDIGSTNYFNDLHMIDFEGLGSIEVAREWIRNNRRETPDFLGKLANEKGAVIAVGHRDVWEKFDCVPMSWIEVGTWVASGNPRHHWEYVFYAVKPSEAERLRSHLKAFSTELPGWVETKLGTDLPVDKSS